MIEVYPIAATAVDWSNYLSLSKKVLGYSVSDALDAKGMPLDLAGFIITINEILVEGMNPVTVLREAGALLQHASASFFIIAPERVMIDLLQEGRVYVSSVYIEKAGLRVAVVSGNLEQWKQTIIHCSSDRIPPGLRLLVNKFMMHFEKMGLSQIWSHFSKAPLDNNTTFKLLPKHGN